MKRAAGKIAKKLIHLLSGLMIPGFFYVIVSDIIKGNEFDRNYIPVIVLLLLVYLGTGGDEKYRQLPFWKRILRLLLLPVILFCILCAAMLLGEHFVPMGSLLILLTLVLVLLYLLLFRKARAHNSQVQDMDGHEFEYYCADILSKNGFRNVTVTPGSNDYGADIVATREGEKWVIQCKRYSTALGNSPVQEVVAAKSYYCADRAAVMTNSTFTGNARSLAEANDVWLVDGEQLELMS